MPTPSVISTIGALRRAVERAEVPRRPVHEEVRDNLIAKLRVGGTLFPGIIGYDDTVVPQLVNALLSQHNFILLGLRGQAKTRLLRDRKSTRLNSSHSQISYAVFCLKKKKKKKINN